MTEFTIRFGELPARDGMTRAEAPLRCPCGRPGYKVMSNWPLGEVIYAHDYVLHRWSTATVPLRCGVGQVWKMDRVETNVSPARIAYFDSLAGRA